MTKARDVADTQENNGGGVAPFVAGKNKIINGDFGVWQRGTSFALTAGYQADRWTYYSEEVGIVGTISQQTFAPGTAPVAGYESAYYNRYNVTTAGSSGVQSFIFQKVEDVRTLANQTVTVSFWAKADTSRNLVVGYSQNFGSGGSASVINASVSTAALTTSWQRFTATFTLPSISGKTIGTGSSLHIRFYTPILTTQTIDLWGIQLEAGSVATPFTTATGTVQGELAACQRYYQRSIAGSAYANFGTGSANSTTNAIITVPLIVSMRTVPSSVDYATLILGDGTGVNAISALVITQTTTQMVQVEVTSTLLVSLRFYRLLANNSTSGYLGFSAEL
jgi:hypothetical protein